MTTCLVEVERMLFLPSLFSSGRWWEKLRDAGLDQEWWASESRLARRDWLVAMGGAASLLALADASAVPGTLVVAHLPRMIAELAQAPCSLLR